MINTIIFVIIIITLELLRLVCRSVIISDKDRKLHFHAPIRALICDRFPGLLSEENWS